MRKLSTFFSLLFLLAAGIHSNGQTASAYWALSATTTTTVANTGAVSGVDEVHSDLTIRDYTGTNASQRSQVTSGSWPAETVQNNSRYIQFSVAPATGNNFTINSIQLFVGGSGGSNMRVNIAYSKDPLFATSTVIYTSTSLPISSLNTVTNSPSNLMLLNGETLYLRVYPFYGAASTGKYVVLKDVTVSGVTSNSTSAPIVSTSAVSLVTATTAKSGGNVTVDGGSAIAAKGVVWGTAPNPTVATNSGISSDGTGMSSFTSNITSLIPNTVYYVRAYATNSTATGYGNEIQFATSLQATNYYNKPNTDITNTANWGRNTDGSGTSPASFGADAQVFNIANNGATISNNWVVLGTDSKVVLGNGVQPVSFTIPSAYGLDGITDISAKSTLTVRNTTGLSFGTINDSATVNFDGVNVVPINYTNLGIMNGANFPSAANVGISGSFNPNNVTVATAGSTVSFIGTSPQVISASFTFDSLRINNPLTTFSGNLQVNRGLVINHDFTVDTLNTLTLYNSSTLTVVPLKKLSVYGTFDNQSIGAVYLNSSNLYLKSAATYKVNASVPSSYSIPAATYEAGSNLVIIKGTGKLASPVGGNLIWNGTNSSTYLTASVTVGGNFTMNSGTLNHGSSSKTLTIGGDLILNGGSYTIGVDVGAGNAGHMVVNGNAYINGGALNIAGIDTSVTFLSTFTLKGNLYHNAGQFGSGANYSHGKIVFAGTNQLISTTGINNDVRIEVGTAVSPSSVTLGSNLIMPATVSLKIVNGSIIVPPNKTLAIAGSADFNNKNVLFKSDSTGTGRLGIVTGTVTNATNVTVERYINSLNKGAFRLLAPSVNSTGTIKANWQTGTAGYGTYIDGPVPPANGFDTSLTDAPSAFTYNVDITPTTDIVPAWIPLPNTNVKKLEADTGYLVYIRGDRTRNNSDTITTNNTTLTATGTLLTGTRVFNNLRATVYNLITNPYASAINWTAIQASNPDLANRYIYWDPNIGSRGGYVMINADGTPTPTLTTPTPGLNIQSGQAFFVRPLNTTSVSIQESHKSDINNINVFRLGANTEKLTTSLYFRTATSARRLADGASVLYNNNYSTGYGNEDALQLANFDEDVAILSNSRLLALEGRPLVDSNETLQLYTERLKQRSYEWEIKAAGFNASILSAVLKDNYLNTTIPLNLNGTTVIGFNVTAAAASSAVNRFQLVYATAQAVGDTVAINMCAGGSTSITSNVAGTQYQWQVYNGTSFINLTNNTMYDGVTNATLNISGVPAANYGTKYRCVVTGGNAAYSKVYAIKFQNYWTGAVSSAWENVSNWSCGQLPDQYTDVIINAGPVNVNANAVCRSLQAGNEAKVIVKQGARLDVMR
jgi:hypothetical protein